MISWRKVWIKLPTCWTTKKMMKLQIRIMPARCPPNHFMEHQNPDYHCAAIRKIQTLFLKKKLSTITRKDSRSKSKLNSKTNFTYNLNMSHIYLSNYLGCWIHQFSSKIHLQEKRLIHLTKMNTIHHLVFSPVVQVSQKRSKKKYRLAKLDFRMLL